METPPFVIEEWAEEHPCWGDFLECLDRAAPEQAPFVLGEYSQGLPCHLLVALRADRVVGFLRFGVQPIGRESGCPTLLLDREALTEAKIHAFAVREESRCQGIGTSLQQHAISLARSLDCHQLASHSSYERAANCRVKLRLGFSALPEVQGSIYFLMPLRSATDSR